MKVLYIGDPHARPDCLEEMQKLVDYIAQVARANQVDYIVFLGDQFHTHSVIHLSVLAFWRSAFEKLSHCAKVFALVGNHDMSGREGDKNNAMMLYNPAHVHVVAEPEVSPWGALMVPYMADLAHFVTTCRWGSNELNAKDVVVCHQTFDGSKYENGFYAQNGIDPNLVPQKVIISGHIHTPQNVGKVWYPGSPRWQSISDANVHRAIYVVDHDQHVIQSFSTVGYCRPIYCLVDREGEKAVDIPTQADVIVDVFGAEAYVRARAEQLEAIGVRVRQFPDAIRRTKVRESDGLQVSFKKFMGDYQPKLGTAAAELLRLAEARISWLRS